MRREGTLAVEFEVIGLAEPEGLVGLSSDELSW